MHSKEGKLSIVFAPGVKLTPFCSSDLPLQLAHTGTQTHKLKSHPQLWWEQLYPIWAPSKKDHQEWGSRDFKTVWRFLLLAELSDQVPIQLAFCFFHLWIEIWLKRFSALKLRRSFRSDRVELHLTCHNEKGLLCISFRIITNSPKWSISTL